jgi:hypothetical protein
MPFTEETLQAAVEIVAPRGSLKFYGGEPTLLTPNMVWAVRRLREMGFAGAITVFSNGIRARSLIQILDADPLARCYAVLNYSIATGTGERSLPAASRRLLEGYAACRPARIFLSHDFLIPVGRQAGGEAIAHSGDAPTVCFHCFPTLTGAGEFHACPFAVEVKSPHFHLGTTAEIAQIPARFARFLTYITERLEPEAAQRGVNACRLCLSSDRPAFPGHE